MRAPFLLERRTPLNSAWALTPTTQSMGSRGMPMTKHDRLAAAVAAPLFPLRFGCCRVADGSDYGGSLRNPAGWNNVFGFRTSYGLVPPDARDAWLPSMGVVGPMARNVADLAMLLAVQAGYDAREPLSIDGDGTRFRGRLREGFQGQAHCLGRKFQRVSAF